MVSVWDDSQSFCSCDESVFWWMSLQVLDDKENYSFKENDDKRVIEAKDG